VVRRHLKPAAREGTNRPTAAASGMRRLIAAFIFCALGALALVPAATREVAAQPAPVASPEPAPVWTPDARSNVDSLIGWPSGAGVVEERAWEDRFEAIPSSGNAADIENHISAVPHRAGTPADYATALYVRDRLRADGFEANLDPFEVFYTNPLEQRLELLAPDKAELDLLEGEPGNHSAAEKLAGPSFMENSGDGDVNGSLFYLNHGSVEDWQTFDGLGVTMPDNSIVIERLGGGSRDPRAGQHNWDQLVRHKVAGLIVYYDPRDDGVYRGVPWPQGNFKNSYMTERIGGPRPGVSALEPPGDPTLPGEAPVPGKKHLDWLQIDHSDIPEMDVTQAVARRLLASLDGPLVPDAWHDGFEMLEHTGGGAARAHMLVKMERKVVTIWNVMAALRGAKRPNESVLIGSHRDAMAFGAIDPGSGTTVLLQVADGYKALLARGWRPDRTIEIASWDGHELGLWGSISLAYRDGPALRKRVVQYVNTDQLTTGPPFAINSSPELWSFEREIAAQVPGTDGKPLLASDLPKTPIAHQPGGGSDHQTFIYWLGVPGSTNGYYGHFGAHHTAEDNIAGLQTYDPGLKEAVAAAQFTGVQAMRAAGASGMPLRLSDVSGLLLSDIETARKAPQYAGIDLEPFRTHVLAYRKAALAFDAQLLVAERSGDPAALAPLARKAELARDAYWMPEGLTYNRYWHTIDRSGGAFPELSFASFEAPAVRDAKIREALERLIAATDKAAAALQ
jgi:N-acetylated-alpha-linked acidic dipeptidase